MSCSICLDVIKEPQMITLKCNHIFHRQCIDQWTYEHTTCPYCRCRLKIITHLKDIITTSLKYQFKKKHKCKQITLDGDTIYDGYHQLINQCPIGFLQYDNHIEPVYVLHGKSQYYISCHLRQIILWCKINDDEIYSQEDDYRRLIYYSKQNLCQNNFPSSSLDTMYNWIYELMYELSHTNNFRFTIDMNSIIVDLTVITIKKMGLQPSKFQTAIIVSIYQIFKIYKLSVAPPDISTLLWYTDHSSKYEEFMKYLNWQNKYIRKNIKIL